MFFQAAAPAVLEKEQLLCALSAFLLESALSFKLLPLEGGKNPFNPTTAVLYKLGTKKYFFKDSQRTITHKEKMRLAQVHLILIK